MTWLLVVVEQLMEWELAGETEVLGLTPPHCHLAYNKSHLIWSEIEPGLPLWDVTASCLCMLTCFMLVSGLAFTSTLKMEATCFSETSIDFHRTTRHSVPDDRTLHFDHCEILKQSEKNFCKNSRSPNPGPSKYKAVQTDHGAWLQDSLWYEFS
jgi:hypothetical protein